MNLGFEPRTFDFGEMSVCELMRAIKLSWLNEENMIQVYTDLV